MNQHKSLSPKPYSPTLILASLAASFCIGFVKIHVGSQVIRMGYDLADERQHEALAMRKNHDLRLKLSRMQQPQELRILSKLPLNHRQPSLISRN